MNSSEFGLTNWIVLIVFLGGTTWFGHALRGKSGNLKEFFSGNNDMPWWAVSGSLIASSTSALTFIAVPAAIFKPGGDLTFFQITIGFVLGNFLLAHTLLKKLYQERFYSAYDFIEARIDVLTANLTRILFSIGAVLSQSIRLLSTALVLSVVTGLTLAHCIILIGIFAVVWTWMGGIKTVIWTDLLQFVIFFFGGIFILAYLLNFIPGGLGEMMEILDAKAKSRILDISLDPTKTYTLWVGLIGTTVFELAQKSIDQVTAQRLFCCRSLKDAQKALYGAAFGVSSVWVMLFVGIGLVAFFELNPLNALDAAAIAEQPDRIVPHFIVHHLPVGVSGLMIATLFAAGISTVDSALAALSQTTATDLYRRYIVTDREERHYVKASRYFVIGWGIVLCCLAMYFERIEGSGLLVLGLSVPGYVYGSILGIAVLAYFGIGRFRIIIGGVILSVASVLLMQQFAVAFFWWYPVAAIILIGSTLFFRLLGGRSSTDTNPS